MIKDDHIILSQFFLQKITPKKDEDDFSTSHYWTNDGLSCKI